MKKNILLFFLIFITDSIFASELNLSPYFLGKSGCFILFDLKQNKLVTKYNPDRCAERIPPQSTFKIPLSLMVFDQKLIRQNTQFIWDGQNKGRDILNQNQTPYSWLKNSVVWVSQELTPKLGLDNIKKYLKKFNYGNQDFSGDPDKNNGLTRAWLSSSLKISADEQLVFLKAFVTETLPVSREAMEDTKANMYLETSPRTWKLYGKTGSGIAQQSIDNFQKHAEQLQNGWFIGFVQKGKQTYLFVLNFTDLKVPENSESGGIRAKQITQKILAQMKIL